MDFLEKLLIGIISFLILRILHNYLFEIKFRGSRMKYVVNVLVYSLLIYVQGSLKCSWIPMNFFIRVLRIILTEIVVYKSSTLRKFDDSFNIQFIFIITKDIPLEKQFPVCEGGTAFTLTITNICVLLMNLLIMHSTMRFIFGWIISLRDPEEMEIGLIYYFRPHFRKFKGTKQFVYLLMYSTIHLICAVFVWGELILLLIMLLLTFFDSPFILFHSAGLYLYCSSFLGIKFVQTLSLVFLLMRMISREHWLKYFVVGSFTVTLFYCIVFDKSLLYSALTLSPLDLLDLSVDETQKMSSITLSSFEISYITIGLTILYAKSSILKVLLKIISTVPHLESILDYLRKLWNRYILSEVSYTVFRPNCLKFTPPNNISINQLLELIENIPYPSKNIVSLIKNDDRSVDVTCNSRENIVKLHDKLKDLDSITDLQLYEDSLSFYKISNVPEPFPESELKKFISNNYGEVINISRLHVDNGVFTGKYKILVKKKETKRWNWRQKIIINGKKLTVTKL